MNSNNLINNISYLKTNNAFNDIENIIETSQKIAYQTVDLVLLRRNWLISKRIFEEKISSNSDNYGKNFISKLSISLTQTYGKGFTKTNLYSYLSFYKNYKKIFHSLSGKSRLLSWTHYRMLLQVNDKKAREWYENEAIREFWSVRTLQRNISTQYYYRILKTNLPNSTKAKQKDLFYQDKLEFIKNPVIAEFLGMKNDTDYLESDLEQGIIDNIQKFLMELGKGYAFIERQQHIHTQKQEYYIDLVFYNYILKCFVLIDLKTNKITHQDVGQMDMYVKIYDELIRNKDDNPTLGIVLCLDTDEDIARYSVLNDNKQLFMSKYKLYLPNEDELRAEIENQKMLYYIQNYKK